jgi:hypothetical protein
MTKKTFTMSFSIDEEHAAQIKKMRKGMRSIYVNDALASYSTNNIECSKPFNYCSTQSPSVFSNNTTSLNDEEIKKIRKIIDNLKEVNND